MKYLTLILLISVSLTAISQEKPSETLLITTAVENYFYGYIERDGIKLYKAFDTQNGTMKIPEKSGDAIIGYKNGYFKNIIPKWANRAKLSKTELDACKLTISNIAIENNQMAIVKLKMEVGDKTYIDILSLQKIKGNWKITNKMYISI